MNEKYFELPNSENKGNGCKNFHFFFHILVKVFLGLSKN